MLLRALSGEKRLLLLENPWTGLDAELAEKLREFLLKKSTATVIISTHESNGFDQKIIIKNGKI